MRKLQDSLLIINKLSLSIAYKVKSLLEAECYDREKLDDFGKDTIVFISFMDLILIDACSFIDEYHDFFGPRTEKGFMDRIIEVKKFCKPYMNRISEWSDLKVYRNRFAAHNLRDKEGNFVYRNEVNEKVPRNIYEVELLSHSINLMAYIIEMEFENEMSTAKEGLTIKISHTKLLNRRECIEELNFATDKSNHLLEEKGRSYKIPIF